MKRREADQRVSFVGHLCLPVVLVKPAHLLAVDIVYSNTMKVLVGGVIFHPDMRIIEIAHETLVVEGDQEGSVAEIR